MNKNKITYDEYMLHSKPNDCWIMISDKVYDVSNYKSHPGGRIVLIRAAKTDATKAFEDVHHSEKALELMSKYYIGDYVDENEEDTAINLQEEDDLQANRKKEVKPKIKPPPIIAYVIVGLIIVIGIWVLLK